MSLLFVFFSITFTFQPFTRGRFLPSTSFSGQAVITGVHPSPPPICVPLCFVAHGVQHSSPLLVDFHLSGRKYSLLYLVCLINMNVKIVSISGHSYEYSGTYLYDWSLFNTKCLPGAGVNRELLRLIFPTMIKKLDRRNRAQGRVPF